MTAVHYGVEDLHRAVAAETLEFGDTVSVLAQSLGDLDARVLRDHANGGDAIRYRALDGDADVGTRRVTAGVAEDVPHAVEVLDRRADGENPHECLDESEHRRDAALAANGEDDAHRVARHVHCADEEDENRAVPRREERIQAHVRNLVPRALGRGPMLGAPLPREPQHARGLRVVLGVVRSPVARQTAPLQSRWPASIPVVPSEASPSASARTSSPRRTRTTRRGRSARAASATSDRVPAVRWSESRGSA